MRATSSSSCKRLAALPGSKGLDANLLSASDLPGADGSATGRAAGLRPGLGGPPAGGSVRLLTPLHRNRAKSMEGSSRQKPYPKHCDINTCQNNDNPVIIPCSPSVRAEGEFSATPKCGFGLMFLSAVEFLALHGLHVTARTQRRSGSEWGFSPLR